MVDRSAFAHLYPFAPHYLDLPGGSRYHYVDEGEGDPVLLVHGNPTWSFYFRDLIRELSTQRRCVAPDHIGCGMSDKPQVYDYTLEQHVRNLEQLVKKLDLRNITLIVHDWGGAIGMGVATRNPERFKRFVILNTAAFLSQDMPWQLNFCRIPMVGDLFIRGMNGFVKGTLALAEPPERLSPEVRAGYLAPYDSYENRVATLRFVQDIPLKKTDPAYAVIDQMERKLADFRQHPALILWGLKDFVFTDRFLERWIDYWPQAEVRRFPDAGHLVLEDAREEILPLVRDFCHLAG